MQPPNHVELESRLDCAADLFPELGDFLVQLQKEDLQIRTKANERDLVTRADFAAEEKILRMIRDNFPDDEILAEESGRSRTNDQGQGSGYCWVIDPVDGTVNYAHGLPLYGVSIGIMHGGEPVAGFVAFPGLGDIYRAIKGAGAEKNGHPIHVSGQSQLSASLIATGFPYDRQKILDELLAGVEAVLRNARGMRRTGAASLDLCWVAEGRLDGLYEVYLNPWDTCAGVVLIREAGGRVTSMDGREHESEMRTIAASNGHIHEELLEIIPQELIDVAVQVSI